MKNMILIIGNGFDLQCGLKSTYNDFFEYKKNNNEIYKLFFKNENEFWCDIFGCEQSFTSNFTIWDMLFILKSNNHHKRWCDIEKEILDTFLLDNTNHCFWDKVLIHYKERKKEDKEVYRNDPIEFKLGFFLFCVDSTLNDIDDFVELIFDHLKKFEESFSKYLSKEITSQYNKNTIILFNKLFTLDNDSSIGESENRVVISFNYTNHRQHILKKVCSIYANIHGRIDAEPANIIFGIDDYEMQSEQRNYLPQATIFSKSVRIITNPLQPNESLLRDRINNIVIYGHSLNKADYSYFQSIFDHYDLYKSNVVLWFAFSKHKYFSEENYINSIRTLIVEYGKTLDNKDHGKNLFHKLLLENRIKKVEIN